MGGCRAAIGTAKGHWGPSVWMEGFLTLTVVVVTMFVNIKHKEQRIWL